jgi:type IV pilus assembly protein PilV
MLHHGSKGMVLMRFFFQWLWKKGKENQAGISLIEVLVGISILAIGMLAVAQMQMSAIQGIDQSEGATVALNLAREQMEDIVAMDYEFETDPAMAAWGGANLIGNNNFNDNNLARALDTNGTGLDSQWDGLPVGGPFVWSDSSSQGAVAGDYEIFWNVADSPATGPEYKHVVVVVRWTRKGKTRTRTLSFVKSRAS